MSKQKNRPKTLEQRRADLNNRKAELEQKQKELDDKVRAVEKKKKIFYLIGLGAVVLGFIFMSFSTILGILVAAAGIGFIVFLNKKGEILLKNNNADLKNLIEKESKRIAADEAAILEEEEAERKRIEEEERKRKEEEERKRKEEENKRKEEELKRQKGQIESEEKGIYGSGCDFSAKALVDRKENLEKIESYFEVDGNLGIDKKVALINSAKESVKDLVASSNVNEIMDELDSIAAVLNIDMKLAFAKRVADIRTALATLTKTEELLGAKIDNFDAKGKTVAQRATRIIGLQAKYNVDSSLPAEEQAARIEAGVKEEEERRHQEEERRRRAAELKQKAAQIQKEIDAIYGVVEAKFGYVSKLLLEGKMKKLEEIESFFCVDSCIDVDKKLALIQAACEKIKALGINEPTVAKLKTAFVKHAEKLGVASNLTFEDMLKAVKA